MLSCTRCGSKMENWQVYCHRCDLDNLTTIITVTRAGAVNGLVRKYKIFVDDQLVGKVGYCETVEFKVPIGRHTLMVKIDAATSEPLIINCQPRQIIDLGCWVKSHIFASTTALRGIFKPKGSLILKQLPDHSS